MSIRMMAGVLQGLEEAQDRSMKISAARDDKRQKDEQLELEKRKLKIAEDELKMSGQPDPTTTMYFKMANDEHKAKEALSKVQDNQISAEDYKNKEIQDTLKRTGQKAMMSLASGQQGNVYGQPVQEQAQQPSGNKPEGQMIANSRPGANVAMEQIPQQRNQFDDMNDFANNHNLDWSSSGGKISIKQKDKKNDLTGTEGLSSSQIIQGAAFAKSVAGVRGMDKLLPAIYQGQREGKTIDQMADELRISGQSSEFHGPIRDAAQEILINSPAAISEKAMDYIDDELSQGNVDGVKSKLKRLSRENAGTDASKSVMGKERTLEFLDEIQDDLNKLEQKGVDTNIFTGTLEQMSAKIGRVNNPDLRKIATKIQTAVMNYRRSMSGAAFSVPESEEYKNVYPSIGRTANFNSANISALKEVMKGDLDSFYSLSMGDENYNKLFNEQSKKHKVGDVIESNGKKYRITGGSMDDPDIEEVQ